MKATWITCWSRSQRGVGLVAGRFQKQQRVIVKVPKESIFRLRFATFYETSNVTITNIKCESAQEKQEVFIQGKRAYELSPQTDVYCDEIHFVKESDELRISYDILCAHIPSSAIQIYPYDDMQATNDLVYCLCGIDIFSHHYKGCISVFGDSISEQGMWSKHIKDDLKMHGYFLLNHGISGNRLLRDLQSITLDADHLYLLEGTNVQAAASKLHEYHPISLANQCFGKAGIYRFRDDVLNGCHHLKGILFAMGVNDLYQPGTFCAKMDELPTLPQFIDGYNMIRQQALKHHVFMMNLAITPWIEDSALWEEKEKLRQSINTHLKTHFSLIEFDDVLCDEQATWKETYHNGDYLHPNQKGGEAMAKRIIQELMK